MGQYQQWLLYQEINQSLQAQLEALEAELATLQERARLLEHAIPQADNQLIQALTQGLLEEPGNNQEAISSPDAQPLSLPPTILSASSGEGSAVWPAPSMNGTTNGAATDEAGQTISPALFAWSSLPNFVSQDISESLSPEDAPQQIGPHQSMDLLPEDMSSFFADEHGQMYQLSEPADTPVMLPPWLHNISVSSGQNRRVGPIDQEAIRTNRLVQRWLERWGRIPPHPQTPPEDASHE
ncbi:MAG: hypothetical protein ABI456_07880 [Ktedonobacteraceae bacterium]